MRISFAVGSKPPSKTTREPSPEPRWRPGLSRVPAPFATARVPVLLRGEQTTTMPTPVDSGSRQRTTSARGCPLAREPHDDDDTRRTITFVVTPRRGVRHAPIRCPRHIDRATQYQHRVGSDIATASPQNGRHERHRAPSGLTVNANAYRLLVTFHGLTLRAVNTLLEAAL
jgi:hypothetical protein